jgi:hypothetical protein
MRPEGRAEIEKRLMAALERAGAEYESAKQKYARLKIFTADLGETHPDGAYAYRQALREFNSTSYRYSHSLIAFSRFIMGKPPL